MCHRSLCDQPPVLVDIGASGSLPKQWKLLAPHSICIAFDADTREFVIAESENKGWKKLYALNRLVADKPTSEANFYLCTSPYCSSTLMPDNEALKSWAFASLFKVEKTIKLPAVDLLTVLSKIGIDYIDWFKTDSQGTDLRIFEVLPANIRDEIIAAEFEPGIIDAYIGEDKLHQLMAYMDNLPFWISQMEIKGSQRISPEDFSSLNYMQRRSIGSFLKTAPGWCEISYLNTLQSGTNSCRGYLLAWIFSTIKNEHGFALSVARLGAAKFQDELFNDLYAFSRKSLSNGYPRFAVKVIKWLAKKFV